MCSSPREIPTLPTHSKKPWRGLLPSLCLEAWLGQRTFTWLWPSTRRSVQLVKTVLNNLREMALRCTGILSMCGELKRKLCRSSSLPTLQQFSSFGVSAIWTSHHCRHAGSWLCLLVHQGGKVWCAH